MEAVFNKHVQIQDDASLMARRSRAVARVVSNATASLAVWAEHAEPWDVERRRYIDFAGSVAVLDRTHRHSMVLEALKEQIALFYFTFLTASDALIDEGLNVLQAALSQTENPYASKRPLDQALTTERQDE